MTIKRFPDGRAKPFLPPHEYAQLRDDDKFLYNEESTPSARITSDKDRENPVEGAPPYGDGLIGRITALEAQLTTAAEIIAQIEPDFRRPPSPDSQQRRIERAREWLADYTKGME